MIVGSWFKLLYTIRWSSGVDMRLVIDAARIEGML